MPDLDPSERYDCNVLERAAQDLLHRGVPKDALRIYLFMADGDNSLDGGHLGARIGECHERMGDLASARFWYDRAVEENPDIDRYVALRIKREEINIYDLIPRSSCVVPVRYAEPGRPKKIF